MQNPCYRTEVSSALRIALLQDDEHLIEKLQPFKKYCARGRPLSVQGLGISVQQLVDYLYAVC